MWLTVRKHNEPANKVYEKIGMKQAGTITWSKGTMEGIVWKKTKKLLDK